MRATLRINDSMPGKAIALLACDALPDSAVPQAQQVALRLAARQGGVRAAPSGRWKTPSSWRAC